MKTTTFDTKEQLNLLCKEICLKQHRFYKETIDIIEKHGATVKINCLFFYDGNYSKHPNLNKRNTLIICVSLYPASISLSLAEKMHMCQNYYSKVGIIKQSRTSTHQLNINDYEDRGMTAFFKRYAQRLIRQPANVALQHRMLDVITNVIFPKRQGSSFNKTYRGFPIKGAIVIALLILLFLFRLITPSGYHPSLK